MSYVITLIAAQKQENLLAVFREKILQQANITAEEWLRDGVACDIFVDKPVNIPAIAGVDVVCQPRAGRRKKMLISDMDSTLIHQECIDEMADMLGIKPQVAEITEIAMRGEMDFAEALCARVALLEGLPENALQEVYDSRISLMEGAKILVSTMKAHGAYPLLVSGGFTFFTARVRDALGFAADEANILEIADGKLTGKVIFPILDKHSKLAALQNTCQKLGINLGDSLAVGDGANDLPMLLGAGLGVAYHAKPLVQQQARAVINYNDLSALLYLQGYKFDEWVALD